MNDPMRKQAKSPWCGRANPSVAISLALLWVSSVAAASTADTVLTVSVAQTSFQLPVSTEVITTPEGNPAAHITVDLSPIIANRVAILQQALVFPKGKCKVSVHVTDVSLSPQETGARVRIDGDFDVSCFGVGGSHHSHVDATLLPIVQDRHRIAFIAKDGEVSGELGRAFHKDVRSYVESAVQKSGPAFDTESVIPQRFRAMLPTLEVSNVHLSGGGEHWAVDASVILRPR